VAGPDPWLETALSIVTIALAMLALVIAGVAIWGYGAIRRGAIQAAENRAVALFKAYFDGQEIQDKLKQMIVDRVQKEGDRLWADLTLPLAYQAEHGQRAEGGDNVAEEYPGEEAEGNDT